MWIQVVFHDTVHISLLILSNLAHYNRCPEVCLKLGFGRVLVLIVLEEGLAIKEDFVHDKDDGVTKEDHQLGQGEDLVVRERIGIGIVGVRVCVLRQILPIVNLLRGDVKDGNCEE